MIHNVFEVRIEVQFVDLSNSSSQKIFRSHKITSSVLKNYLMIFKLNSIK